MLQREYKFLLLHLILFGSIATGVATPASNTRGALHFPKSFLWGVANAPGHVENGQADIWHEHGVAGKIAGYKQTPLAPMRLNFWSNPDKEIQLARELGVKVFRIGIDWGRLFPTPGNPDPQALSGYKRILKKIRLSGMKIMLTLFHHSGPLWLKNRGGFQDQKSEKDFLRFAKFVVKNFAQDVDWFISFNEPQVYASMTKVLGQWPNQGRSSLLNMIDFPWAPGEYSKVLRAMASAHKKLYRWVRQNYPTEVLGIANNFADYRGHYFYDRWMAEWLEKKMNWYFLNQVGDDFDFLGINYYGAELFKNGSWAWSPKDNYSDSGRAISPLGFRRILEKAHRAYPTKPLFVTENGIADSSDKIRPYYIYRHLEIVHQMIQKGIRILGYVHWTLSDNLEWSDGYCPKFGLVAVDRAKELKRRKRASFHFYKKIVKKNTLYPRQKLLAKKELSLLQEQGICRQKDGLMPLARPRSIFFKFKQW